MCCQLFRKGECWIFWWETFGQIIVFLKAFYSILRSEWHFQKKIFPTSYPWQHALHVVYRRTCNTVIGIQLWALNTEVFIFSFCGKNISWNGEKQANLFPRIIAVRPKVFPFGVIRANLKTDYRCKLRKIENKLGSSGVSAHKKHELSEEQ